MKSAVALSALSMLAGTQAAETVLGAYIFHRHGDRTAKALGSTQLTTVGYEQVHTSGEYYRSRYLSGDSKISGISEDQVKLSQIQAQAPADSVLQLSAMGFLQGLYPPVKNVETLASGQQVQAPLDGYQLIPINTQPEVKKSEDSAWLQDASDCQNAKISSNSYFDSKDYQDLASSTKEFYSSLVPSTNNAISKDEVNFKNAYLVYDLLNVAEIHNSSIPNSDVLTNSTLNQLRTLSNAHEWGLAYNASDDMRAIAGMQLTAEIVESLGEIISSKGAKKFGVQFGSYGTFLSFFGLADLPKASPDFTGIPDYASSMAFELFTEADVSSDFPAQEDLQVRFLFSNGTASNTSEPSVYPLFGGKANAVSWQDFSNKLGPIGVGSTQRWCDVCGVTDGECTVWAAYQDDLKNGSDKGISPTIGGVIGAFITLAVVLGSLAAFMLIGGFRLVSKKALSRGVPTTTVEPKSV